MNILIVGSGAREHAIAAALHRSPQSPHLFCCGTTHNPGIQQMTYQYWVGDIWLEDIVYIFMLGLLGGLLLLKQGLYPLAFFVLTFLTASMFIAHRDISRYTLPVIPFILIAFEKILVSKEFKIVLIILSLVFYLYSQNYIINNVAPVPNLSYFN